jgi:hypothetical protein
MGNLGTRLANVTQDQMSSKQGSALWLGEAITVKQKLPHLEWFVSHAVMPTIIRKL